MEPHIALESVFLAPLTRLLTLIGFWASWPPPGSKHGHNPHIDVFVVMSVPISWDALGVLNSVQIIEISDFSPALFPVAINLRVIRLRPMWAFKSPTGYFLRSTLLQMLGVKFYRLSFVSRLLEANRDGHGSGSGYKPVDPDPDPQNPNPIPRVYGLSTGRQN
ncbi:hypothetical protein B0H13DRAFT_1897888 [Mycena leptocephala]|nr:hypothetical protein B0H13DRAFT_1897888 [Mycena leptocephala]